MNPVLPVASTLQVDPTDPNPAATPPQAPRRPSQPTPVLSSAQSRATKPALLALKLNLPKGSGEADGHHAGPSSPSSRSKTKVQRATTDHGGGQKRAIDGLDGPGSTEAKPGKRQKISTPPNSPRSNTASLKQLVRQSRPVSDLKAMAGLSPRRAGTASPPASPRATVADDSDKASIGLDAGRLDSSGCSALIENGQSAPRWRLTSDLVFLEELPKSDTFSISTISHSANPLDEYPLDFTFSECGYGDNGELQAVQQPRSSIGDRHAQAGTAPAKSQSISSKLILAEFGPKANAQKIAAASYIAGISCQAAESAVTSKDRTGKGRGALAGLLKRQQDALDTEVILVELALGQNGLSDMTDYLNTTAARLADIRLSLADLAALDGDGSAGTATVATRLELSASLDALEVACKFGVDLLADEMAPNEDNKASNSAINTSTNAAEMTQTVRPADPAITPSNTALIAELELLDALMDAPILPARSRTAASTPKKQ